jgi:uncharacterized protein (DUF58 family)
VSLAANSPPTEKQSRTARAMRGLEFADPRTLMRIKNLQLRAQTVVEGFFAGIHRSPYHGFSVEFSEYRQYTPGDDLRYLDWRLFGRSDRYFVKRFEDETNLLCYLLTDASRSMGYGSGDYSKYEYARTLAATIAYFLYLQRDAVGLATFDQSVVEYLPPRHRPGHMRRLTGILQQEPRGRVTDLAQPLEQIAQIVRKRGLVILISDLLADVEPLKKHLGYLRSRGHDLVVLRVLDPAELEFTFGNPSMFVDVESGRRIYIDPAAARQQYRERFQTHADQIATACRDLEVDYMTCSIDRPLELALFDLLRSRIQRGQRSVRNERKGGRAGWAS